MPFPILIPIAIAAAGALAKAAPALSKQPEEKFNKKRIKELESGKMGMSDAERKSIEDTFSARISGAQGAAQRQTSAALANAVGSGSGDAQGRALAAGDQYVAAAQGAAATVEQMQQKRVAEDKQELNDRLSFQAQTRRQRIAGLMAPIAAAANAYGKQVDLGNTTGRLGQTPAVGVKGGSGAQILSSAPPVDLGAARQQMEDTNAAYQQDLDTAPPPPQDPEDAYMWSRMGSRRTA